MSYSTKNKWLIGLLLALLLANIATITVFWLGKQRHPVPPKGQPSAYLIKELGFDAGQQTSFLQLVKEHQAAAEKLRQQVRTSKDKFFALLQQPLLTDSEKMSAVKNIGLATEQLDLVTFDHFKKVRALCNAQQQQKFDNIIGDVLHRPGGHGPEPGMRRPGSMQEPPPGPGDGPPPPGAEEGPPPPR